MSKLSFKSFSVENYAEHTKLPSSTVYKQFKKTGLLKLLDADYEDLHGMSFEYLMQFFDEYLQNEEWLK